MITGGTEQDSTPLLLHTFASLQYLQNYSRPACYATQYNTIEPDLDIDMPEIILCVKENFSSPYLLPEYQYLSAPNARLTLPDNPPWDLQKRS
jgi:hypothetical protein